MRKKIFASITAVMALALVLTYVMVIAVLYSQVKRDAIEMLRENVAMLAVGLDGHSRSHQLDILEDYRGSRDVSRITFVAPNGHVLFDSLYNEKLMENHADRPEIASVLSGDGNTGDSDNDSQMSGQPGSSDVGSSDVGSSDTGNPGEGSSRESVSVRGSATASQDLVYLAHRLDDGSVIRVARSMQTLYASFLQGLPVLIILGVILFIVAFLVAWWQAKSLVKPFEDVDLDHPLDGVVYPEFRPLLERLARQNENKDLAAARRREFSANVSHELKTPLTSISGYAELIRDGLAQGEDVPGFADRIHQESSRLLSLISDIIALSRLDETDDNEIAVPVENVDIEHVAQAVVKRFADLAQEFDIELEYSGMPAHVRGQPRLIDEMLANLVDNAIKYNRPKGHVRVWAGMMRGLPSMIVTDTGLGIAPADQERVFERFYRVDKSHSKETGGTGLGLSIVKHVAHVHGATVNLDSEPNRGTRVCVSFPACSLEEDPLDAAHPQALHAKS